MRPKEAEQEANLAVCLRCVQRLSVLVEPHADAHGQSNGEDQNEDGGHEGHAGPLRCTEGRRGGGGVSGHAGGMHGAMSLWRSATPHTSPLNNTHTHAHTRTLTGTLPQGKGTASYAT